MRGSRIRSSLEDIAYHHIFIFYHLALQIEVEGKKTQADIDIVINTCVITKGKPSLRGRRIMRCMFSKRGSWTRRGEFADNYLWINPQERQSRPLQERKMQTTRSEVLPVVTEEVTEFG